MVDSMISSQKLQAAIDEIREISKIDFALYTESGKLAATTFQPETDMRDAVLAFVDSMAENQMLS